eukprot:7757573-Alexandrium_andersonii.AAC.1
MSWALQRDLQSKAAMGEQEAQEWGGLQQEVLGVLHRVHACALRVRASQPGGQKGQKAWPA